MQSCFSPSRLCGVFCLFVCFVFATILKLDKSRQQINTVLTSIDLKHSGRVLFWCMLAIAACMNLHHGEMKFWLVSVTFPLSDHGTVQINHGRLERKGTRKECGQGDCWTNKFLTFGLRSCVRRKKSRCSQHKEILPAVEWDTR